MAPAKKVIWIGLDGASVGFFDKFIAEGKLPTFARLREQGVFSESLPIPPCDTPTNWSALQTGAHTGTTEVVSFFTHVPGEPLHVAHSNTDSRAVKAELFWEAAERQGKRCIVLNWPCSWPSRLHESLQIDGTGPLTASWRIGYGRVFMHGDRGQRSMDPKIAQKLGSVAVSLALAPAEGWGDLPASSLPPLAAEFELAPAAKGAAPVEPHTYYLLVYASGDQGYDRVLVARARDRASSLCSLAVGEWSGWLSDTFPRERVLEQLLPIKSETVEGVFQFKLLDLDQSAKSLALYRTDIWTGDGYAQPPSLAAELREAVGPFAEGMELPPVTSRLLDDWITYEEQLEQMGSWYVDAARYLTQRYPWDVLAIQWHTQDGINHVLARDIMEEESTYTPEGAAKAWQSFEACYVACDRLVAGLMEACADDDTVVCVVSDHGALPTFRTCLVNVPLTCAGLMAYKQNPAGGSWQVDYSRSKVFPRRGQLWVNLQGRDPDGIVPPAEFESVREQAIQALLAMRDPENGASPIVAALRKEDAVPYGQWGDRVGDVAFFMAPRYADSEIEYESVAYDPYSAPDCVPTQVGCAHHLYLPTGAHGIWRVAAVFFLAGPGVRRGYRRAHPLTQVDVAPTLAHLIGMKPPAQCEGKIVSDLLE